MKGRGQLLPLLRRITTELGAAWRAAGVGVYVNDPFVPTETAPDVGAVVTV